MKGKRYLRVCLVTAEQADAYPEFYKADTDKFPHLLKYLEGEVATVLWLDLETQEVYSGKEFSAKVYESHYEAVDGQMVKVIDKMRSESARLIPLKG